MEIKQWLSTDLGRDIWSRKYQNENETFDEWIDRVSGGDTELAEIIVDKKFLFGGRILSNRGLAEDTKLTYSNCYVLKPPGDSIEEIYETAAKLARTFSYGGGVGIDISQLRPKGYPVNNAAKTTSGAVSFMDTFELVSRTIGQAGRRGALMLSIDCNHPDVKEFIDAKLDNKLEKCNISVRMSDEFMAAADNGKEYESNILNHLAKNNWDWAEPGILYWDTIRNYNLLSEFENFEYAGVNPCAEEPLPAGGSCLLGAINLAEFVVNPFTDKAYFDMQEFRRVVEICIRALNQVLDEGLSLHPLQEQRDSVRDWRQIGLGIMGYGDAVLKLGYDYGTLESRELIQGIGGNMVDAGLAESARLAAIDGAFPMCDNEKLLKSDFILNLVNKGHISQDTYNLINHCGLRNSQLFTIAPTGSISTMLGVTGGVEPIFATHYTRKTQALHGEDTYYRVYTPIIDDMLKYKVITEQEVDSVVTAQNLRPMSRVLVQAAWQQFIDASISSTVNLTEDATVDDVRDLYIAAWETGCKGLTIYRAGCQKGAVLSVGNSTKEEPEVKGELKRGEWAPIPDDTVYIKQKVHTGCGKLNLFIGWSFEEQRVVDIYAKRSGQGGCEHNIDSTVICMSGMLRLGGTIDNVEKALQGCGACNSFTKARAAGKKLSKGKSCPTAIFNTVKDTIDIMSGAGLKIEPLQESQESVEYNNSCPECGAELSMTGGCNVCSECGYTKCD